MMQTTIHVSDAIDEAEQHYNEVLTAYEELKETIDEEYDSLEAAPNDLMQRRNQYRDQLEEALGMEEVIETTLRQWDEPTKEDGEWQGDGITLEMLSGAEAAEISDRVSATRVAIGEDLGFQPDAVHGSRAIETLKMMVVDAPAGAPADPGEWPQSIMLWVYDKAQTFNRAGDPYFEPTPLEEAIADDTEG